MCSHYKNGVKGMMRRGVEELLSQYLDVERLFQVGHYDKVVSTMRQMNKDNINVVVERVFAHTQYRNRNVLVTALLDRLWRREPRMIKSLRPSLLALTDLVRPENSTVSLKARTILIASERPSYELRHNHIEKMFLDAISKRGGSHDDDGYGDTVDGDGAGGTGKSNSCPHLHSRCFSSKEKKIMSTLL